MLPEILVRGDIAGSAGFMILGLIGVVIAIFDKIQMKKDRELRNKKILEN